jgi:hypothetical protein
MGLITPPLILTPFANTGDQTVIPPTDPNGFVNFANGYTPDYEINLGSGDPQAKAVERPDDGCAGVANLEPSAVVRGLSWRVRAMG